MYVQSYNFFCVYVWICWIGPCQYVCVFKDQFYIWAYPRTHSDLNLVIDGFVYIVCRYVNDYVSGSADSHSSVCSCLSKLRGRTSYSWICLCAKHYIVKCLVL